MIIFTIITNFIITLLQTDADFSPDSEGIYGAAHADVLMSKMLHFLKTSKMSFD